MNKLHIDIETYSSVNLKTSGNYKYTESIDFQILLVAYAFNHKPIRIIDLAQGEELPEEFIEGLRNPDVIKCAHNATFERNAFKQYGFNIPIEQWECTMVKAAYCGLPLSLEFISKALDLGEDGKLATGKALIRYFCIPCKPTKINCQRLRNFPYHDLDKWESFKLYCIGDVIAERKVDVKLSKYVIPEFEKINYVIDQEINDRGIKIDYQMAKSAFDIDQKFSQQIINEVRKLTGIENPNSPAQLKKWLGDAIKEEVKSLAKELIPALLEKAGDNRAVSEVLKARLKLSKSSTKKYVAMMNCICYDGRAHGLFQFYGASRTGRWAGRLIQLQNLPQNHISDLEEARKVIASGDYDLATMLYDNVSSILSELIRTAFVAKKGFTFVVSDFSAIEARILAWLAGEEWRMKVFRGDGKIYEASASRMFGVPIEEVTKGSDLRQKGKTAELALGYQGSVGAMTKMGGEKMGMTEKEMRRIVKSWRKENKEIVRFWYMVENCSIQAIKTGKIVKLKGLEFDYDGEVFTIELPSGRKLFYQNPGFTVNNYGKESIRFMGMDQVIKKWGWVDTYGGKLTENIVQAISRDLLAYSLQRLKQEGFETVMHVHDEAACEVPIKDSKNGLHTMNNILSENVPWAPGLPLVAEGYITPFYKKD